MGCNMSKEDEVPRRKFEHLADSMVIMTSKGNKEQAAERITQHQKEATDFVPRRERVPRSQSKDSLAKGGDSSEDASE